MRRTSITLTVGLVLAGLCLPSLAGAEEAQYLGSSKCKMCHIKQYKSWEATTMATSFETLKPQQKAEAKTKAGLDPAKDYTQDETCLPCHTVGYGKPGGYAAGSDNPGLLGVGCECCHGPGSQYVEHKKKNRDYKRADIYALGMTAPDEANCLTCHNEKSPTHVEGSWDYEKAKAQSHEHLPLKREH